MSDIFLKAVADGLKGINKGLYMGLPRFNSYVHGVQKKYYYVIGGGSKSGKTSFCDNCFILQPYLKDIIPNKKDVEYHFFSMEIDLIEKMAKWTAYIMDEEYGIYTDPNYILGRTDKRVSPEHLSIIKEIHKKYMIPLFGEMDEFGVVNPKSPRIVYFYQDKLNPDAIDNTIMDVVKRNGEIIYENEEVVDDLGQKIVQKKIVGYKPYNPNKQIICIVDHAALCKRIPGLSEKENIDKLSSNFVKLRNLFGLTVIVLSQFNRDMDNIDRIKFSGNKLAPTRADFKATGNLSEDANLVIGLMNPYEYPSITNHLGYNIEDFGKSYRSVHIIASRNLEANTNISVLLEGKTGRITELPRKEDRNGINEVIEYIKRKGL